MIAPSKNLQRETVAEGLETEEQRAFLRKTGWDQAQGYLLSRPLQAEEITERLEHKPIIKAGDPRQGTLRLQDA